MRALLLERARADGRIAGAAVAGSAAADAEDRWSDIDLCFSVAGARSRPTGSPAGATSPSASSGAVTAWTCTRGAAE